ncbi:DCR1A protein, partial [Alcedo cyanopectus]|nr:DCR1A protein [Ceyx cyanopectus]
MSEDALLEEDIWEYKSIRKQKHQSNSEGISTPLQEVSDGKCRPKRKRNRYKNKSIEKADRLQKTKQRSRPNQDVNQCKDDSSVHSQESVSSLTEQSSQNAKPIHDGYCPSCQMPFSLLLVQTPRWHVAECLDAPGSTEKECPGGLLCTSTIPSHYKRYSHFLLAASRAGDYLVNSSADTLERKMMCSTATKPSCSPSHVEEISQEKPSNSVKNIPSDDCALMVQSSLQMKCQNRMGEITSSGADVPKPQQTFHLTQSTDNSCKFEFYDFASSQDSGTGEILCSQKDIHQPSLLLSKADFSDCEISYSPLSTFEESEEETEEEKKVKISQNKLFKVLNFKDEESNSAALKPFDRQYEHTEMENLIIKKKHCEEANTLSHTDHSIKPVSQSHLNSKFFNSTHVDNQHQQEALNSASSFNCKEVEESELISSAAKAANIEAEDTAACTLDSAYVNFTDTSLLLVGEDAVSLLTQKSNILRDPTNILKNIDEMTANAVEKTAFQENLQSVVEEKGNGNLNPAAVCFPSPISKTVPSHYLASMNANSSPAKELKQMDIGVFFGLKPKVKEESKEETCLGEGKQMPSSVTPNGKRPRQKKRKAEGSVEDVEAVKESSSKTGVFADVNSGGQQRWRKKFKDLSTAADERTKKKYCPFYKKIPGTGFTVDAFQYGEIEGCTAYFLTHFHSDHYRGLTKNFMFPIYCNKV